MQTAPDEIKSSGWVTVGQPVAVRARQAPAKTRAAVEDEPEFQTDDEEDGEQDDVVDEEKRAKEALRAQAQRDIGALVATIAAIDEAERCVHEVDTLKLPVVLTHGKVRLRDHQVVGVKWMWQRWNSGLGGCVLADEMGLGKTAQALALLASLHDRHCVARRARAKAASGAAAVRRSFRRPADWKDIPLLSKAPQQVTSLDLGVLGPHLIVAPTSLVSNWAVEAGRFAGRMRCLVLRGSRADRKQLIARLRAHAGRYHIVITSFSMIEDDEVMAALRVRTAYSRRAAVAILSPVVAAMRAASGRPC
jgi:SNF2 family DNA or RNA helicase